MKKLWPDSVSKGRVMKKALCSFLSVLLAAAAVGCSNGNQQGASGSSVTASGTASQNADTAKAVTLQFYMLGDAPKNMPQVSEKINELTKKDLNCTVEFHFTTWTNYTQKYSVLLSSGEPVDLLYTAPWASYGEYAKKGAFKALNDLLPKYAPELYQHVSQSDWDLCKLDGNIYTIPSTYQEYFSMGLMYREDLRKKYNLPVPNTWDNCEKYMSGIKTNMPGQLVTNDTGFLMMKDAMDSADCEAYGMQYDYYNPSKISQYWGSQKFLSDMKDIKGWADKGFWSKSVLSDKTDTSDLANGKIVITTQGINPNKYVTAKVAVEQTHPDWEVGYVPGNESLNYAAYANHPLNNGYAVPTTSENPERALMFYQKMVMDKTYNQLTEYGVEGTDYTVKDGVYQQVGDGFGYEGMSGWSWRNPDFMLKNSNSDELNKVFAQLKAVIAKHPKKYEAKITDGFIEDTSSYETEKTALETVETQYLNPILYGEVSDVDSAVKIFMEKANQAGLQEVQQGWEKQWMDYCKQKGY